MRAGWIWPVGSAEQARGAVVVVVNGPEEPRRHDLALLRGAAGVAAIAADRQRLSGKVAWAAHHHLATGLPNRRLLVDRLSSAMNQAAANGALLRIALGGVTALTGGLGSDASDAMMIVASTRVSAHVSAGDTVARVGEDELAILLPSMTDASAARLGAALLAALSEPVPFGDLDLRSTVGIGVASYPRDGADEDALLRAALGAVGRARLAGTDRLEFAAAELAGGARSRLEMEARLRGAIDRGELFLHYQPKVHFDGILAGFEALLRWRSPELGSVSPAVFIPIAEDCGLIPTLGTWVLECVAREIAAWEEEGLPVVRVSVNVSPIQFAQPDFVATVASVLARSGAPAARLELEVTESAVMQDTEQTVRQLTALRALGLAVSIDDFGTGHSSLAWLQRLPIDTLKIDRSLVTALTRPGEARGAWAIVSAVVSLAHELGLLVVAEGVETAAQADLLRRSGCDCAQGSCSTDPGPWT